MTRIRTVPAHLFIVAGLGIVLAACKGGATWGERLPAPQIQTQVIGGIPVATMCEDLPDLTEAEVAYVVALAEKHMQGLQVRRIVHSRGHPGECPYLLLQFEYEETRARIRFSRSIVCDQADKEEGAVGPQVWGLYTELEPGVELEPGLEAEVCAPGRSYLEEHVVPESDIVHVGVSGDLSPNEIVEIVDAAYNHVPAGEEIESISRMGSGGFWVETVDVQDGLYLSGSVLKVQRRSGGWSVTPWGQWAS